MWFNFIRDQDMRKTLLTWCYCVTLMENEVRWHLCRGLRGRTTLLNVFLPQITRKVYLIQPGISYITKRNVLGLIIVVNFFLCIQMANASKDLFFMICFTLLCTLFYQRELFDKFVCVIKRIRISQAIFKHFLEFF